MTDRSATTASAPSLTRRLDDEQATARLGAAIASVVRPGDAILLSGPYGAGKTCLARAFLRAATGDPALVVPSPSFTLLQTYPLPSGLMASHYDFWRIGSVSDLGELGWDEARAGIVVVEWPERIGPALPPDALRITLGPVDRHPEARDVALEGWSDRLGALA